jgi:protein-S-isoprenylcysteine O-methyltransferase Ste14
MERPCSYNGTVARRIEYLLVNETLFRIIFSTLWLIFIANLAWVRYSSIETTEPSAIRADRRERRWHIFALALFAPLWFGGIILYALVPGWISFFTIPLPTWFRLAMAAIAGLSIPFTLWGYRTLGKNWVHALGPAHFMERKRQTLETGGPYCYVRNPIYLGAFTFILALALEASNWFLLVPDVIIISIIYLQIDREENAS